MNLFEMLHERFRFTHTPIRLFEAFSGYGSQLMALKRLGVEIEHIGMSDWWITANKVYYALHGNKNIYVENINDREILIRKLMSYGLSNDDKKPVGIEFYKRKKIEYLQWLYKILIQNKNYGAIGTFKRLPKDIDICTWSFPCQDISLAGKQKGMTNGTKSNYGYVFLDTVEKTPYHERPKVLLMENVKALFSQTFQEDWREIQLRLERLGYSNYADVLNAKDYAIPQNRERVFIVSILGEYYYEFPKPVKLEKRLKDYLEDVVDEKYYLSEEYIKTFTKENTGNYPRKQRFLENVFKDNKDVANTITTRSGERPTDNFILIPEATKQGYAEAHDGDGVYINRPHQKRGVVQKGMIQTIKTSCDDVGVVIDLKSQTHFSAKPNSEIAPTQYAQEHYGVIENNLHIRKLTPREALRLMDVSEHDIDIILSQVSDTQAYKLAGNSIVVNVLVEIFRNLF